MIQTVNRFELDDWIASLAEAGRRMSEIGASEGAAGNLSVCLNAEVELTPRFPLRKDYHLPVAAPGLAGMTVLVSGSGRRLRDLKPSPYENLGAVLIGEDGVNGWLYTAASCRFARPTSEFNTHLAVHNDQMQRSPTASLALIHAQPVYLTYLSHLEDYQDADTLNRQVLRWQPEAIINFPQGIGVLPFQVPGSYELMEASVNSLRSFELIVWSKHGVLARSECGFDHAMDNIEYAEAAAHYEYLNLVLENQAAGLSPAELEKIAKIFGTNIPPGY
ncbi:MAG TPA: class II aldolase/adducin family protein [Anaerolineales bacterium]|nr:class II aldolase/adducin family protein [Anaerolineales bacterium]